MGVLIFMGTVGKTTGSSSGQGNENFWHYKITPSNGFIIGLLFLVILALGERVLYDLARVFVGANEYNYFDNLATIGLHAIVISPLLAISITANVYMGENRQKYAVVLIPYFVATVVLALQLALQVSTYFYNHHTETEFYIVMFWLVFISSVAIYLIQERFNKHLGN